MGIPSCKWVFADALVMAIAALAPLLGYAPQLLQNMLIVAAYLSGWLGLAAALRSLPDSISRH